MVPPLLNGLVLLEIQDHQLKGLSPGVIRHVELVLPASLRVLGGNSSHKQLLGVEKGLDTTLLGQTGHLADSTGIGHHVGTLDGPTTREGHEEDAGLLRQSPQLQPFESLSGRLFCGHDSVGVGSGHAEGQPTQGFPHLGMLQHPIGKGAAVEVRDGGQPKLLHDILGDFDLWLLVLEAHWQLVHQGDPRHGNAAEVDEALGHPLLGAASKTPVVDVLCQHGRRRLDTVLHQVGSPGTDVRLEGANRGLLVGGVLLAHLQELVELPLPKVRVRGPRPRFGMDSAELGLVALGGTPYSLEMGFSLPQVVLEHLDAVVGLVEPAFVVGFHPPHQTLHFGHHSWRVREFFQDCRHFGHHLVEPRLARQVLHASHGGLRLGHGFLELGRRVDDGDLAIVGLVIVAPGCAFLGLGFLLPVPLIVEHVVQHPSVGGPPLEKGVQQAVHQVEEGSTLALGAVGATLALDLPVVHY